MGTLPVLARRAARRGGRNGRSFSNEREGPSRRMEGFLAALIGDFNGERGISSTDLDKVTPGHN